MSGSSNLAECEIALMGSPRSADEHCEDYCDVRKDQITRPAGLFAYGLAIAALVLLGLLLADVTLVDVVGVFLLSVVTLIAWRFATRAQSGFVMSVDDLPAAAGVLLLTPVGALALGDFRPGDTAPSRALVACLQRRGVSGGECFRVACLNGLTQTVELSGPRDGAFAWFVCGLLAVLVANLVHDGLLTIWTRLVEGQPTVGFRAFVARAAAAAGRPAGGGPSGRPGWDGCLLLDGTARLLPITASRSPRSAGRGSFSGAQPSR